MKISKQRVEAFSDGVIAIIVTIMVLNIPLPKSFAFSAVKGFLDSIFVFFASFFIVALQWNKHRHLFDNLEKVTNKIVWRNFLFLFFLSLMPIFTKWVMQNPDEVIPAISYDILFLLLNISYMFMFNCGLIDVVDREQRDFREGRKASWMIFVAVIFITIVIFVLSFFYPRISIVFFIGLPVASSLLNLWMENRHHGPKIKK
jgi:uncharacterized membrane protein